MMKIKLTRILAVLILLFTLFTLKGLLLDPDFGWHLVTGQYMLQHGIPAKDPFSYSMPSYPLLDHEWLSDITLALLYPVLGMFGLAMFYSIIAVVSISLQFPKQRNWLFLPLLLSGATLLLIVGVKQQIVSWILFSLLIFILKQKKNWQNLWFFPVYFLFWANVHGSFPLGLTILFITIVTNAIQSKKINLKNLSILLLTLLATGCNPYGIRLWQEVSITLAQPEIHFILAEWYPSFFVLFFPIWILIFLSAILLWQYRKQFTMWEKTIWCFLLLIGLQSIRNIPYWVIFSLPLTTKSINLLYEEARKNGVKQFKRVGKIFTISIISISLLQGYFIFLQPAYPENAILYLKRHLPAKNIFSDFNWGGYQLWQIPEKKVFIDGQMSNWRQKSANKNESNNAFQEFFWVANRAEGLAYFTQKYHISTLLLTADPFTSWQQHDINLFNTRQNQKYPTIIEQLKNDGWHLIYKDKIAVIYQKRYN
jgi:hypothetical protein